MGAGIDFIRQSGMERIAGFESGVARCVYEELCGVKGVRLYTPAPQHGKNLPVFSFNIDGLGSEETTAKLNEMGFAVRGGCTARRSRTKNSGPTTAGRCA